MKKHILFFLILFSYTAYGQKISIPADTIVESFHETTINNKQIHYKAEVGTQPVWNQSGEPIATLFYTYYKRIEKKNEKINRALRPIIISFNGGPGSGSLWMHTGYTGPRVLKIDDEGFPVQPYGMKDNPNSILDVADIVYVCPVNTGYSRMLPNSKGELPDKKLFFGINADVKYLATWINTFITRKNIWESPKYIIGESYGGTRVMGLAHELQNSHWMYLNGVIMVSPADYKVYDTGGAVSSAINLPYYTATAWYHKVLDKSLQERDLLEILPESENFTINELLPAIAKGGFISTNEKTKVAKKMSYYSGISFDDIISHNLDVPTGFFWKELVRDESGYTVGRLDSRYLGLDKMEAGSSPDTNAELDSWEHSFTPAINYYMKNELNFSTDIKYNVFGPVHPWNRENDNTRDNLRQAMAQNPYLKVLIQSGYYDGATTYFQGKYTMWQTDPSGKMKDRFTFKGYRSGHMMYLRAEDLESSNQDLRNFIINSLTNGKSAKY